MRLMESNKTLGSPYVHTTVWLVTFGMSVCIACMVRKGRVPTSWTISEARQGQEVPNNFNVSIPRSVSMDSSRRCGSEVARRENIKLVTGGCWSVEKLPVISFRWVTDCKVSAMIAMMFRRWHDILSKLEFAMLACRVPVHGCFNIP